MTYCYFTKCNDISFNFPFLFPFLTIMITNCILNGSNCSLSLHQCRHVLVRKKEDLCKIIISNFVPIVEQKLLKERVHLKRKLFSSTLQKSAINNGFSRFHLYVRLLTKDILMKINNKNESVKNIQLQQHQYRNAYLNINNIANRIS